jgi:hypothetical protein
VVLDVFGQIGDLERMTMARVRAVCTFCIITG